jgi:hypothetical protein
LGTMGFWAAARTATRTRTIKTAKQRRGCDMVRLQVVGNDNRGDGLIVEQVLGRLQGLSGKNCRGFGGFRVKEPREGRLFLP